MLLLPAQHPPQPSSFSPPSTNSLSTSLSQILQSPKPPLTDSARWSALTSRNPAYANAFIYAVTTTKIYCRPNCPSRLARRANIEFFATPNDAVRAGYRACKRCKPEQGDEVEDDGVEKVRKAVAVIRQRAMKGEKISLAELSMEVGLSKWHLQRAFKRRVGKSPREMGEELEKGTMGGESDERKGEKGGVGGCEAGSETRGMESEKLYNFSTSGSSENGLTDSPSKSWSYTDVSSLPTPALSDVMPEWEETDWLTGVKGEAVIASPFGQDLGLADTDPMFNPDVEIMIRDLFPEIYSVDLMDLGGSL